MTTVINGTSTSASAPAVVGDDSNSGVYFPSSDQVAIATNGTQRLFIDSGGNAVLGTADPGNWSVGPSLTIRNKGNAIFNNGTSDLWMVANGLYDGGWSRAGADVVSGLELAGGGAYIYAADTGSAGSAFSFTQILNLSKGKTLSLEGASSQTGTGITFPASQNASSNANTLDDYEEGSWTPTVGGTATYIANSGDYTKIGNFVYIRCILNINVLGTGSTSYITGLPFAPDTKNSYRNGIMFSYWSALNNSYVFLGGNIEGGQVSFIGTVAASTGVSDGTALFKNGSYVIFSGCYQTA